MAEGVPTIIYPVQDLARAKSIFSTLLNVEPVVDQPYYVGFDAAGQHVGLDPNGHRQGITGPTGYWPVDDIRATIRSLVAAGATVLQEPKDVGGGKLVAIVRDGDGNGIGLTQSAA